VNIEVSKISILKALSTVCNFQQSWYLIKEVPCISSMSKDFVLRESVAEYMDQVNTILKINFLWITNILLHDIRQIDNRLLFNKFFRD
jgi:hypothetical protein